MVRNDFNQDIKELLKRRGQSKTSAAAEIGMPHSAFNSILFSSHVTRGIVEICEYLSYDIEVKYVVGDGGILNDFRSDVRELAAGRSFADIAHGMGVSRQLLNGRIAHATIAKSYINLCRMLGFSLELKYIRR